MNPRPHRYRIYDKARKEWVHDTKHAVNLLGETIIFGELLRRHDDTFVTLPELAELMVMEFTGLHDRHGIEIYEGDILKLSLPTEVDGKVIRVVFSRGYFGITGNDFEYEPLFLHAATCEVVGNICDNPIVG